MADSPGTLPKKTRRSKEEYANVIREAKQRKKIKKHEVAKIFKANGENAMRLQQEYLMGNMRPYSIQKNNVQQAENVVAAVIIMSNEIETVPETCGNIDKVVYENFILDSVVPTTSVPYTTFYAGDKDDIFRAYVTAFE